MIESIKECMDKKEDFVDVDKAWVESQKKFFSDGPRHTVRTPVKESNIPDKYDRKIFLAKHKLSYAENNAYFHKLREAHTDIDRMELARRADEVNDAIGELNRMAVQCRSKHTFATDCKALAKKFSELQKTATLAMNIITSSYDTKSADDNSKSTKDSNYNPLNDF